ncbi:MAG: ATP-binding protein [Cyclobacteriaceae bacterium]|jgi:signal transduction histidine kinase
MKARLVVPEDFEEVKSKYFADPARYQEVKAGEVLLSEGEYNDKLYLILEGAFTGYLRDDQGNNVEVFHSRENMFVGVYSFFSNQHLSYMSIVADVDSRVAYLDRDELPTTPDQFALDFLPVLISEIYARQSLTQQLNFERQRAMKKLAEAEKMATLGQLAAGLAHELNNAIGILESNTQRLTDSMDLYLRDRKWQPIFRRTLEQGLELDTRAIRTRRDQLEQKFDIPLKVAKQLARINLDDAEVREVLSLNDRELEAMETITTVAIVLRDMKLAARHAAHVVRSVRDLGATPSTEPVPITLRQTIEEALTLTKKITQGVSVTIQSTTDAPLTAHAGDFVQVWINLIKNACEAINLARPAKPAVQIVISETPHHYHVAVTDNGTGISDDTMKKIFEPSFTTKVSGLSFGLGLGLSIVKRIVDRYRGSVLVASKPGETTFTVRLPKP